MKKILMPFTALFTALLVLWSCAAPMDEIMKLIPENTLFYFQINNPDQTLEELDQMIQDIGLQAMVQGESVKELLSQVIESEAQGWNLEQLSLDKPFGFAFLPDGDDVAFRLLVPAKDPKAMEAQLVAEMDPGTVATISGSYIVFDSNPAAVSPNPIETKKLTSLSGSSFLYYLDGKTLKTSFGGGFMEELDSAWSDMLEEMEETGLGRASVEQSLEIMKNGIEDWDSLLGTGWVNPEIIGTDGRIYFQEGSGTQALLESIQSSSSPKDLVPYLSKNAILNTVFSGNSPELKALGKSMNLAMMAEFAPELVSTYEEILEKSMESLGDSNGMSLGLNVVPLVMGEFNQATASPEALLDFVKNLELDFYLVSTIKDEALFQEAMELNFSSGLMNTLLQIFLEVFHEEYGAPKMTLEIINKPEALGLPYYNGVFEFNIQVEEFDSVEENQEVTEFFNALLAQIPFAYGQKGDLAVFAFGNQERINQILGDRKLPEGSLGEMESLTNLLQHAPSDLLGFGHLSLDWATQLATNASGGMLRLPRTQGKFPGLVFFSSKTSDSIHGGLLLSFEEIVTIVKPVAALAPMFF